MCSPESNTWSTLSPCCKRWVELVVWDIPCLLADMFLTLSVKLSPPHTSAYHGKPFFPRSPCMKDALRQVGKEYKCGFQAQKPTLRLSLGSSWLVDDPVWGRNSLPPWRQTSLTSSSGGIWWKHLSLPSRLKQGREETSVKWVQPHHEGLVK